MRARVKSSKQNFEARCWHEAEAWAKAKGLGSHRSQYSLIPSLIST